MSATLLIGRWPMASRRFTSQSGDGPIFTPRMRRAAYRGHRSGSLISTEVKSAARPSAFGGSEAGKRKWPFSMTRSEEHTSELQSRLHLVCRLLLEKKK